MTTGLQIKSATFNFLTLSYVPAAFALEWDHGAGLGLEKLDEHLEIRDLCHQLTDQVVLHLQGVDDLSDGGVDLRLQLVLAQFHDVVHVQIQAGL